MFLFWPWAPMINIFVVVISIGAKKKEWFWILSVFPFDLRCTNAVRAAWKWLDNWLDNSICFSPIPQKRDEEELMFPRREAAASAGDTTAIFSLLKSWRWSRSQPEGLRANGIPELSAWTPSRHHISEEARVYICLGFPADLLTALTMRLATERGGASVGSGWRWFS